MAEMEGMTPEDQNEYRGAVKKLLYVVRKVFRCFQGFQRLLARSATAVKNRHFVLTFLVVYYIYCAVFGAIANKGQPCFINNAFRNALVSGKPRVLAVPVQRRR